MDAAFGGADLEVPARQKEKVSRTFTVLTFVVIFLDRGWKLKEAEFRGKLLNLLRHLIPSLTVWFIAFKVLD